MNVTPCAIPLYIFGGVAITMLAVSLGRAFGRRSLNYLKSIEFVRPDFNIPQFGRLALKLALPAILLGLFIAKAHLVDCKDHQPIVRIEDCHCGVFASK